MFRVTKFVGVGLALMVLLAGVLTIQGQAQSTALRELPPDAKAGECYAKVLSAAAYKSETQKVVKKEASETIEIIPAKYEWVDQKVVVKEGHERTRVIPAKYKWVEEKVQTVPASSKVQEVPAVYDRATEKVLVKPAQTVWKAGRGPIEKIDNATGEIMCRVEEPAVYKTVRKRVLKTSATTRKVEAPAQHKIVRKQVIAEPEKTEKVKVPAEHTTIRVKKLVKPAQEKRVPVPAEYETVTKQVKVSDGKLEWQPVLCQTNMSPAIVTALQNALSRAGFDPGPIDGMIGGQTLQAVNDYQRKKGLSQGALTLDTLRALGVSVGTN